MNQQYNHTGDFVTYVNKKVYVESSSLQRGLMHTVKSS